MYYLFDSKEKYTVKVYFSHYYFFFDIKDGIHGGCAMYPNCTLRLKNSHTILGVANQLLQEAYHSHDLVTIRCTHIYML